jgi:hypothetical protein
MTFTTRLLARSRRVSCPRPAPASQHTTHTRGRRRRPLGREPTATRRPGRCADRSATAAARWWSSPRPPQPRRQLHHRRPARLRLWNHDPGLGSRGPLASPAHRQRSTPIPGWPRWHRPGRWRRDGPGAACSSPAGSPATPTHARDDAAPGQPPITSAMRSNVHSSPTSRSPSRLQQACSTRPSSGSISLGVGPVGSRLCRASDPPVRQRVSVADALAGDAERRAISACGHRGEQLGGADPAGGS